MLRRPAAPVRSGGQPPAGQARCAASRALLPTALPANLSSPAARSVAILLHLQARRGSR